MNKKGFLALLFTIISSVMLAQVPDAMTLQSVIRNTTGELATNKNITLQISILQGSASGTIVYVENFSGKTNANGLITMKIGMGTPQTGTFSEIDWSNGPYFICVAADVEGGMNFATQSTTQLLSVPYAIHAKTAESLSSSIKFSDITDVPDDLGFSGKYSDLTGAPELATVATSGEYEDLTGTPELAKVATSGNYADLTGTPDYAKVATSGNYEDLTNRPELSAVATSGNYGDLNGKPVLSTVAISGSYNDLTDKPNIAANTFSGNYQDLSGKPSIQDSISKYGFSGDYNKLSNKPNLSQVAYSGDYNDLKNTPTISGGMISDYNLLTNRPNLRDTVEKYAGTVTDYNMLLNKPSFKDSVETYTGAGDYNMLKNRPNIKDSVETYGFSGNYNDLANTPNINEMIEQKSFSGKWDDIEEKPTGSRMGALMYYNTITSRWQVLEPGNIGDILIIGTDGYPTWTSAAFLFKNMATKEYIPIQFSNYSDRHYTVEDEYKFLNASGYIEVPEEYEVSFLITPETGWGVKNVLINGVDNDSLYFTENGITYVEFAVENIEGGYTIDVNMETHIVELINVFDYLDSIVTDSTKDYFNLHYDTIHYNVGYNMPFISEIIKRANFGISSILIDGIDMTDSALQLNQIRIENVSNSMQVVVTYKENLFNVGDWYYENGEIAGIVYNVREGGKKADVISTTLIQSAVTSTWTESPAIVSQLGSTWRMPTKEDAEIISKAIAIINSALSSQNINTFSSDTFVWTTDKYSDTYATAFNLVNGYVSDQMMTNLNSVIAIKQITK